MTGLDKPDTRQPTTEQAARKGEGCVVIHPSVKSSSKAGREERHLAEAIGLAQAINLNVVHAETVTLSKRRPATLFGAGAIKRLGQIISDKATDSPDFLAVAIVDAPLTPVQQRNLEQAWLCA